MPKVSELLRRYLLKDIPERLPDIHTLLRTERNSEFDRLCMNRKIVGAMRYGRLGQPDKPEYNRVKDMIYRLEQYKKDRNKEHLVDVANLAECEFVEGDGVLISKETGHHTEEK